ncbi:MAG TPA: hypothetical protein VFM54_09485, partial [Micromonosporaceae bacterium]|nr:hypothetical protein [Micromonosporaceae bacterium]
NVSVGTVKSQCSRALASLRQRLGNEDPAWSRQAEKPTRRRPQAAPRSPAQDLAPTGGPASPEPADRTGVPAPRGQEGSPPVADTADPAAMALPGQQ